MGRNKVIFFGDVTIYYLHTVHHLDIRCIAIVGMSWSFRDDSTDPYDVVRHNLYTPYTGTPYSVIPYRQSLFSVVVSESRPRHWQSVSRSLVTMVPIDNCYIYHQYTKHNFDRKMRMTMIFDAVCRNGDLVVSHCNGTFVFVDVF